VLARKYQMLGIFTALKIGVCISQMTVLEAKITTQMTFSCKYYLFGRVLAKRQRGQALRFNLFEGKKDLHFNPSRKFIFNLKLKLRTEIKTCVRDCNENTFLRYEKKIEV